MNHERLVRIGTVMEIFSIKKSTVWQWCQTGKLPKPIKLSPRVTVWRMSDLQDFMVALK